MIKYIGSKRTLIPLIQQTVQALTPGGAVLDLFSGTSRVGHALKAAGYQVTANDHNAYAATIARCYVQADLEDTHREAALLVEEFNRLPGAPGYFTATFCEKSRFFRPENGARIDAIREAIERKELPSELRAVMLTSLLEAADRVDSTMGLQMAYLKQWAPRAHNSLELRVPALLSQAAAGKGQALQLEAVDAARQFVGSVAYIDPPYNQHKYLGNYHIWESLVLWDKPSVYGVACKRVDCKTRTSPFNSRIGARSALEQVLAACAHVKHLVVSFSDEGFISRTEMEEMLAAAGRTVNVVEQDYKRYVGAQTGIHSPSGVRVGEVSHLRNKEYLYTATRKRL